MNKTIAIAGMGWLGLPLARHLKTLGFHIKGSVTKLDKATTLQKSGFDVYPVTISEDRVHGNVTAFLKKADHIIVMIPPGLRRNKGSDYVLKMSHFLAELENSSVTDCIFVSSTSVYGNAQETVTEKDLPQPENDAGRQLLQVEQLFFNSSCNTSIVRFGGLLGGNRQPARYLAGRENLDGAHAPVNLIHRDDCIQIISEIIKQQAFGHIFNAVHPDHPIKIDYYTQRAAQLGLKTPHFASPLSNDLFKQVDSVNLKAILEYSFSSQL